MEIIRDTNSTKLRCIKCNEWIIVALREDEKLYGASVQCRCGCIQKCVIENQDEICWRVMNPFN